MLIDCIPSVEGKDNLPIPFPEGGGVVSGKALGTTGVVDVTVDPVPVEEVSFSPEVPVLVKIVVHIYDHTLRRYSFLSK